MLKDTEMAIRALRKNFMVAAVQEGRAVLHHIQKNDLELAELIAKIFSRQEPRAAFWLATEMDKTGFTPLQQLNRGRRDEVKNRLLHYTALKHR